MADALPQQEIADNYTVIRELGCGTYGRVLLATCQRTRMQVALKVLSKKTTKQDDFIREFNISYCLATHRSIIKTYDVAFESAAAFVFAQEYAPVGDLFEAITPQVGLAEHHAKSVARQVVSALDYMHSKDLVHRDIKPENIMLFDEQFHRVKLMDFGLTKKRGTQVRKVSNGIPYTPPEICEAFKGDCYSVDTGADVWAFAILLYTTLTGNFPWEMANVSDSYYVEFLAWQRQKTTKVPSQWTRFWPKALQMFRKLLEIKPDRRCPINEVARYLDDEWLIKATPSASSTPSTSVGGAIDRHSATSTAIGSRGASSIVNHSIGSTVNHSIGSTINHSTGSAVNHSIGSTINHSIGSTLNHSIGSTINHSIGSTVNHSIGSTVNHPISGLGTSSAVNHYHVTHDLPSSRGLIGHCVVGGPPVEVSRYRKPALHDRRIKDWLLTT